MSGETWLVVNGASGSNGDGSVESLTQALAAAGRAPSRVIDLQQDACPGLAELAATQVGLLAVFGGDGSLNTAIRAVEGWDGEVLALPGGTANLLARSLHGDAAVESGAEAIIAGLGTARLAVRARNCVRCGGHTALIEVLAGPGAAWSDVREGLREGGLAQVAGSALDAAVQSTAGPMVRVVQPALGRVEGYSGVRLTPGAAHLEVEGYGAQRLTDYVLQGIALLRRDFREGPHDELGRHRAVRCRSADGSPIELMIDGERATGAADEQFSLAPLAVKLLARTDG